MFAVPGIFLQAQHQPRTSQGGAGLADGGKGKHTRKLFCTRLEITCQADGLTWSGAGSGQSLASAETLKCN